MNVPIVMNPINHMFIPSEGWLAGQTLPFSNSRLTTAPAWSMPGGAPATNATMGVVAAAPFAQAAGVQGLRLPVNYGK